ncbi:MAG: hypothetical protein CL760_00720 [Chloroflexi bacterium]|nr:hypothetical protein [Chloroflexota bacterium]
MSFLCNVSKLPIREGEKFKVFLLTTCFKDKNVNEIYQKDYPFLVLDTPISAILVNGEVVVTEEKENLKINKFNKHIKTNYVDINELLASLSINTEYIYNKETGTYSSISFSFVKESVFESLSNIENFIGLAQHYSEIINNDFFKEDYIALNDFGFIKLFNPLNEELLNTVLFLHNLKKFGIKIFPSFCYSNNINEYLDLFEDSRWVVKQSNTKYCHKDSVGNILEDNDIYYTFFATSADRHLYSSNDKKKELLHIHNTGFKTKNNILCLDEVEDDIKNFKLLFYNLCFQNVNLGLVDYNTYVHNAYFESEISKNNIVNNIDSLKTFYELSLKGELYSVAFSKSLSFSNVCLYTIKKEFYDKIINSEKFIGSRLFYDKNNSFGEINLQISEVDFFFEYIRLNGINPLPYFEKKYKIDDCIEFNNIINEIKR